MNAEAGDFCCRVCGSSEYETIRDSNGVIGRGFRSWVLYYVCSACSAVFMDPEKFSVPSEQRVKADG